MQPLPRRMYVLMPFRAELNPVYETLIDVAGNIGYECLRADKDLDVREITEKIITGIFHADIVVADLSESNPNVLYELGIANALSKECIMLCQQAPEELPFDTKHYVVQKYSNTHEGRQTLKERLLTILSRPSKIQSPVNRALDAVLERKRTLNYVAAGAVAGPLLSLPASLATALLGHNVIVHWQAQPGPFRTVVEGAPLTFVAGALFYGAWAVAANLYGWELRRKQLVIVQALAGLAAAVTAFAATFLLDVGPLGPEVALGTSLPWLLAFLFGGFAFGLTFDAEMTRRQPKPLALHVMKTAFVFGTIFCLYVFLIHAGRATLFFPPYLERYDLLDSVGDALRSGLWGIEMVALHWWLRWHKRL